MNGELTIANQGGLSVAAEERVVPALVAVEGERAARRYVEFFTANIRNPNTRAAYARAASAFFAWCEQRGLTLRAVQPVHVAAWIEQQGGAVSAHRQAATGRRPHAVQLAGRRPSR